MHMHTRWNVMYSPPFVRESVTLLCLNVLLFALFHLYLSFVTGRCVIIQCISVAMFIVSQQVRCLRMCLLIYIVVKYIMML